MPRSDDATRHRADMPAGSSGFLNTRSLATLHRRLAELLRPGLCVLDVGCGTGAMTRGIAADPHGRVVGIDVHPGLIAEARFAHRGVPRLAFEVGDLARLGYAETFDIVTAARVLQWLANPSNAL